MEKLMAFRYKGFWLLVISLIAVTLAGCSALAERLAAGTAVSGQQFPPESEMTLEATLPEGEGIGGGDSDSVDGLEEPGAIGTAIQKTLNARGSGTPEADQKNTLEPTITVPWAQYTALAQTYTAMAVSSTPTFGTPEPDDTTTLDEQTQTSTPTPTPTPGDVTPEPPETPCLALRFVFHYNYPPGSQVLPDTGFFKRWYVQNVGSCTWTANFGLVYVDGFQLHGTSPTLLQATVPPGEYVILGIQLFSNPQPGNYYSNWMLQDSQGNIFGGGEDFTEPLVVEIIVPGEMPELPTSPVLTAPPFSTVSP
jgi:hypothetical protein